MIRAAKAPLRVGERYSLHEPIAAGGMAKVYYGRLHGMAGFSKLVAIKRIHTPLGPSEERSPLLAEARLGARVAHPNVVQVLDVVESDGETFLVMEYIHGEPLSVVIRTAQASGGVPPRIAATIVANALYGLHAAHEARNERGEPIGIVHMDVSPQNIMVGSDGVARLLDFGIATTAALTTTTTRGQLKGKIGYMAPEQLEGGAPPSRRIDVYGAAVCLWEALTASRLFDGDSPAVMCVRILHERVALPSSRAAGISPELDAIVMRGLSRDPAERYETALEMAAALERAVVPATPREVAAWLAQIVGPSLAARARTISHIESERRITTARPRIDADPVASSGTFTLDPAEVRARAQRTPPAMPTPISECPRTASAPARPASPSVLRLLFDWGPAIGLTLLTLLAAWAIFHGDGTANVLRTLRH